MSARLLARLARPEYLFRPRAGWRRLRIGVDAAGYSADPHEAELPWSQTITVFPDEIGRNIAASGVFDICVTEAIHRLIDRGDLAVDVGANVGYLTSLMATRAAGSGRVVAFEPNPLVFALLESNVARLDRAPGLAAVEAERLAVSSSAGRARFRAAGDVTAHMGLGSIVEPASTPDADEYEVEATTLDRRFPDAEIQLLKVDVEGHEEDVLRGAAGLLEGGRVRDVIFEDHGIYPTATMSLLERCGMTVLGLDHTLFGPRLYEPSPEDPPRPLWPGPNFLATVDPVRAHARLRARGWRSLGR